MAVPEFLKQDGNSLVFKDDGELVFYIPEDYFRPDGSLKYAEVAGDYVNSIGFFNYEVFDKNNKSKYGLKLFCFPCMVAMMPSEVEKVKNLVINKKVPEEKDYRLLHFKKDDVVIVNIEAPQDIANTENIFKIFMITGRIPNTIPYDKLHEYLKANFNLNGGDYGITAQMYGIIISETCRDKDNVSIPFRNGKNIDKDMHGYKTIPITQNPNYIDPYVSITSQYWAESLMSAVLLDEDKKSPLEKVMMN